MDDAAHTARAGRARRAESEPAGLLSDADRASYVPSAGFSESREAGEPFGLRPPQPPIALTPATACSPNTAPEVLWHIARHAPDLRRWLAANPNANAALLEFVAQAGGPGVKQALDVLLESMEDP